MATIIAYCALFAECGEFAIATIFPEPVLIRMLFLKPDMSLGQICDVLKLSNLKFFSLTIVPRGSVNTYISHSDSYSVSIVLIYNEDNSISSRKITVRRHNVIPFLSRLKSNGRLILTCQ
jgi:hypothetical protein